MIASISYLCSEHTGAVIAFYSYRYRFRAIDQRYRVNASIISYRFSLFESAFQNLSSLFSLCT